jgi:hypothetical protein
MVINLHEGKHLQSEAFRIDEGRFRWRSSDGRLLIELKLSSKNCTAVTTWLGCSKGILRHIRSFSSSLCKTSVGGCSSSDVSSNMRFGSYCSIRLALG